MLHANRISQRGGMLGWGLPAAVALLGGVCLYSLISLGHERTRSQELASANQNLRASLQQVQGEMQAVSDKLSALASQPPPPPAEPQPAAFPHVKSQDRIAVRPKPRVVPFRAPARHAADDARFQQLEAKVADQQKAIADARQQADQNRLDLEGKLNSQHDELSGSIAKTHDEVVVLQKRGERNYYEFDLDKSKQFKRVGPLSLSVRRVNLKHKYYDLVMTVDDQQLEKKHVNLYEPLMLTVADRPQPIELVVNEIKDNEIKGYVSDARYKKSELASTTPEPVADPKTLQRR